MSYERAAWSDLRSGIGPNYEPFIAKLEQIAQRSGGSLRVALVEVPLDDERTLYGAALLDAETTVERP